MRNSRFDSAGTNSLYMMLLLSKKAINIVLTFASNTFWVALKTVNAIPSIAAWIPIELVAPSLIPCDDCSQKGWILIWRLRTSFCFPAWTASWKAHVLQTWRNPRECDSGSAIDSYRDLCWRIPEALWMLPKVCRRLFWRPIKLICLYLLFCLYSDTIHRTF